MLVDFESDLRAGLIKIVPLDWSDVHRRAERLSEKHTIVHGHRAFDILHVATALHLGAREFLTFDANQRRLAEAEGLTVPL
jgi:predicted nucleic acid-binding protein